MEEKLGFLHGEKDEEFWFHRIVFSYETFQKQKGFPWKMDLLG